MKRSMVWMALVSVVLLAPLQLQAEDDAFILAVALGKKSVPPNKDWDPDEVEGKFHIDLAFSVHCMSSAVKTRSAWKNQHKVNIIPGLTKELSAKLERSESDRIQTGLPNYQHYLVDKSKFRALLPKRAGERCPTGTSAEMGITVYVKSLNVDKPRTYSVSFPLRAIGNSKWDFKIPGLPANGGKIDVIISTDRFTDFDAGIGVSPTVLF